MMLKLSLNLFSLVYLFTFLFISDLYAQKYYPLEIGNRWNYYTTQWDPISGTIDTSYSSFKIVSDSVLSNGEKYFVVDHNDLTLLGKYVRCDKNNVYYYDEYTENEDTVFRLNVDINDLWNVSFGSTAFVSVESIDTFNIFGYMSRVITFRLDGLILYYVSLSDIFGPLYYYSSGEPPGTNYRDKSLYSCVIDSVQYGRTLLVDQKEISPYEFSLSQNFPNPFNPDTKIQYSVKNKQNVSLKVFDILGKEIATLVNEEKPAGNYEVEFNAEGLVSGIYFYRLRTGTYSSTKKMILLR